MNLHIEARQAHIRFLIALLRGYTRSWRNLRLICIRSADGIVYRSEDFDTVLGVRPMPTKRAALAEFIRDREAQIVVHRKVDEHLTALTEAKLAEIRSYGIDPDTLAQFPLFGKFNPEFPWKYTPGPGDPPAIEDDED